MVKFLDLPTDVLLQILGPFEIDPPIRKSGLTKTRYTWEGRTTLQSCRLTCRALNNLASGMLCPAFSGGLNKKTMERIRHLCQNPLIAKGMRVVEINLSFHPKPIADDPLRYFTFVDGVIEKYGICDYKTEFANFDDWNQSEEAVQHRALMDAFGKYWLIRESWRLSSDPESQPRGGFRADASYQQLFQDCLTEYRRRQQEEEQIINDGSFVEAIAEAMSHLQHPGFLSLVGSHEHYFSRNSELVMAEDKDLLVQKMLKPLSWLKVEEDENNGELVPARLLIELPIACDRLGVSLQGLQIGCFPLTRSFASLLPPSFLADPSRAWSELSSACRRLKYFELGQRGMNCTPFRKERTAADDCEIINAFLGTLCSMPELSIVGLNMITFRVSRYARTFSRHPPPADLYYQAGAILHRMKASSSLKRVCLRYVELSQPELEAFVDALPRSGLQMVSLSKVHLNKGWFANSIEILKARKLSSPGCKINIYNFGNGEFGTPKGFDNSRWLIDGDKFWDNLDKHGQSPLLQLVQAYLDDLINVNPLFGWTAGQ